MTTVFVSGAVANKEGQGGSIWVRMSWAEAFRKLGFDVVFVEEIDGAGGADTFEAVMGEFGFDGCSALIDPWGRSRVGMSRDELLAHAGEAELLVNISGHLRWQPLLQRFRRRAYIDLDPGFTQIWHAQGNSLGVGAHDLHFTVGENIRTNRCGLPTGGIRWRPIRQPVVLEQWPCRYGPSFSRFTTVGSWRGAYGPVSWAGHTFGGKVHEFRRFLALPGIVGLPFEVALDIHPGDEADLARLRRDGWRIVEPGVVSDPPAFRRFVQESGAEFSVAQRIYVETRCGWFSDRTVRYLASGKPALVQDTGFSDNLPADEGIVAFRTPEEAVRGARRVVDDYDRHRAAARRIAEQYFAPEPALAPLLDAAGVAP